MSIACGTKWSASSALYANGRPWRIPHRRSSRAIARTTAKPPHAQRRPFRPVAGDAAEASRCGRASGASAVAIDRVVAVREDALEAPQWQLVAGVVADVDDRLVEDRRAERVDGHAAGLDPALELVRAFQRVRAGLRAGDDLALADGVEDPARVGDQLVVRQRDEPAATDLRGHARVVQRLGEAGVEFVVVGERVAQRR